MSTIGLDKKHVKFFVVTQTLVNQSMLGSLNSQQSKDHHLGNLSMMVWHQVMKPSVTSTAADTESPHSVTQHTASTNAEKNELSSPLYMNIDILELNVICVALIEGYRYSYARAMDVAYLLDRCQHIRKSRDHLQVLVCKLISSLSVIRFFLFQVYYRFFYFKSQALQHLNHVRSQAA